MNDNSSKGRFSFVHFHYENVKRNWAHLAEKFHNQELRSLQYLSYHANILIA